MGNKNSERKTGKHFSFLSSQFFDNCIFITSGKAGTTQAISPYLLGKTCFVDVRKTQFLEECRMVSKSKYFW